MKNFEQILSTETFDNSTNIKILKNEIIIQTHNKMLVYNINSLEVISNKSFVKGYGMFYKYCNNYVISHPKYGTDENTFLIYKIKFNNLEKYCEIKSEVFKKLNFEYYESILAYNHIFILKNKSMVIFKYSKMYLLKFSI